LHLPIFKYTRQEKIPISQSTAKEKNTTRIGLVIIGLLAGACLCFSAVGIGGLLIYREELVGRWPFKQEAGLKLDRGDGSGDYSGVYCYYHPLGGIHNVLPGNQTGRSCISAGGGSSEKSLQVNLEDKYNTSMLWEGVSLDGYGALTLEDMLESDVLTGLKYIPLDAACQGRLDLTNKQLAAQLYPLQIILKYQISNRTDFARQMIDISPCNFGSQTDPSIDQGSQILLTPAQPIPVVFGYFPFDAQGAVEPDFSRRPRDIYACLAAPPDQEKTVIDRYGPCQAMFRGACGADCEPNNCQGPGKSAVSWMSRKNQPGIKLKYSATTAVCIKAVLSMTSVMTAVMSISTVGRGERPSASTAGTHIFPWLVYLRSFVIRKRLLIMDQMILSPGCTATVPSPGEKP